MMSEDSAADGTTDCPICLCPIPSEPWGVVSPCGHPYHRECWDQVAAHASARGRRTNASCAVCNGATSAFIPVFLSLGNNDDDDGVCTGTAVNSVEGGINTDGDEDGEGDDFDILVDEWDGLWKKLETLCGDDVSGDESDNIGCAHNLRDGNDDENGDESDNNSLDTTDDSDHYVADIYACINLTQHSREGGLSQTSQSVTQTESSSARAIGTGMQESEIKEYKYQRQKQARIREILERLNILHIQILSSQQSCETNSTPASNNKKLQRLKSKVQQLTIKSTNSDSSSQIDKLEETLFVRTIEAKRTNRKYENLQSHFSSLQAKVSNLQKYVIKSKLENSALQTKGKKVQDEYTKLKKRVGSYNGHEIQEIISNYTKMSQEIHDVKLKNAKLENELGRKKREWKGRLDSEQEKNGKLEGRLKSLLDGRDVAKRDTGKYHDASDMEEDDGNLAIRGFKSSLARKKHSKQANGGNGFAKSTAARQKTALSTGKKIGKRNVQHQLRDKLAEDLFTREGAEAYYAKPAASATCHEDDSPTRKTNVNITQKKSKAVGASGRDSSKKKNKAMDALGRSSSQKFAMNLKRPAQRRQQQQQHQNPYQRYFTPQLTCFHDAYLSNRSDEGQTHGSDNMEGVELMMRTNSSKKHRKGSCDIGNDSFTGKENNKQETIYPQSDRQQPTQRQFDGANKTRKRPLSSSSTAAGVTASRRQKKGNITTFFKPINVDDTHG